MHQNLSYLTGNLITNDHFNVLEFFMWVCIGQYSRYHPSNLEKWSSYISRQKMSKTTSSGNCEFGVYVRES